MSNTHLTLRLPSSLIAQCYPDMTDDCARLAVIPIRQFLRLVNWNEEPEPFDSSRITEWEECPMLILDPEEKRVTGHEGKHRLAAAQLSGYSDAEIMIELLPHRFTVSGDLDGYRTWKPPAVLPAWQDITPQHSDAEIEAEFEAE